METGEITGREITENQDADSKTLLLQVRVADDDDIQTVELQNQSGIDSEPPDGSRVFILDVSDSFRIAIAVDDGIEPDATIEAGEKEIYASDAGTRMSKIRWKKDGQLVINDGGGTAVEFGRLKTAFDQLKDDFDGLVDIFNYHIHATTATVGATPTVGVISPTTTSDFPSTANIDPAESPTIEVP